MKILFYLVFTTVVCSIMTGANGAEPGDSSSTLNRTKAKPNILFIFSDDHAYQSIGCYGSKINKTPNIDRIAKQGIRFDRCYVTNSICGPMRAVIQTGKYSHVNGFCVNGNEFDGSQQTFPKLLQSAGYQTAVVGKWHLGTHQPPQGFDYSEVLIGQGPYYNPSMLKNGEKTSHVGYTTEIITDLTMGWLREKRDPEKPFMLMYQHKAPHRNWQPGLKYLNMYDDVTIPEPETLFDDYQGRGKPARTQDMSIEKTMSKTDLKFVFPKTLNPEQRKAWDAAYGPKNKAFKEANLQGKELIRWKYQRYIKDYLRCIACVDDNIGRVLDYLEQSGLADNTIVVYSSDQGFYLGEHGWFDKRWMYEESLRTPFVINWPGVTKPGTVNAEDIVSPLDFAETFCEIASIEVPEDMQGRSLVPILKGSTPKDWRKVFYYQYYDYPGAHSVRRHYGVTDGRHKLIRFYEPEVDEWEMFDLASDPNELNSIYNSPVAADDQARMMAELDRLRAELNIPDVDPPASHRKSRKKTFKKKEMKKEGKGPQKKAG